METAQNHVRLPCKSLITPFKTSFSYLIHSFRYIIENNEAINYVYESMYNVLKIIRGKEPYLTNWAVTRTFVMTMRRIVGIVVKNQSSGGK